jgi:rhamnogalacturonyl hydrolase YesR
VSLPVLGPVPHARLSLRWSRVVVAVVVAASAGVAVAQPLPAATSVPVVGVVAVPRHSDVVVAMKRAADYYRGTYPFFTGVRNGWSWSTYFQGVHALFRTAGDRKYLADAMAWGQSNGWSLTAAEPNPDSIKAGQTYHDLNQVDPTASLAAMDARMSTDLATLPDSAYNWIDALFMGLPNWTRWATRTGSGGYLDKMDALFAWTRDDGIWGTCSAATPGLYDSAEQLWYRDCRYVGQLDGNGQKIFWGRGNAWVLAAMAQVIATLPAADARAVPYQNMLRSMAGRLLRLQGADGFWRSSLLDSALYPQPETSSTALFTYAIAYGINAGLLDRATYVPVVARAWSGLTATALRSTGFVSFCQPGGDKPAAPYTGSGPSVPPTATSAGTVNAESPPFCVGAFLLAGSEMARLTGAMSTGRPVSATAQQVGNEADRAVDGDVTTRWSAYGFPQSITVDLGDFYRASNAMVVPYLDRAYRYRIDTSADGVSWLPVVDRTSNTARGSATDNFAWGTVNVRYARLTVTGVYGDPTQWVSIQEFAVHDRYDPRPNVARGRPTTATSSLTGYPPGNATDNRSGTLWVSAVLPTATAPQRLTVDLQASVPVDTVRVFSRAGYGPRDVAVLGSVDGTAWTVLGVATLSNVEGPHMMLFPDANVRWLRLQTTSAYGSANVQVEELEAYPAG